MAAALVAAVALSGDVLGAPASSPSVEVVVTLRAPALSGFGRTLQSAAHGPYRAQMAAAQAVLAERVRSTLPGAEIRWHYHLVANGFAVALPRSELVSLAQIPGVARVWPSIRYHALRVNGGPDQIGAPKIWGPNLETSGQGMKIGIIDDGIEATNPYFDPAGLQYPPGFPKGQTASATPKVIVQRTFAPPGTSYRYANTPFDPTQSFHATHVAGIAAGVHNTTANGTTISGVAPAAYLGNYKALTVPTPGFGLDGNSAELAAAIEAAVADGMNVINLSLGEPEVDPSRDIVVSAINAAAAAGVVPVVAAGNDFGTFGYGSVSSPANAQAAIAVAAVDSNGTIADFSSAGPTPLSLEMKPDVSAPGVNVLSSLPAGQGSFGLLSGTSMATPHVAGAAALLLQRHPSWTVAEVKSALVQSGYPVRASGGAEALASREGGGIVDLPRADSPLLFADPTGLSFGRLAPGASATQTISLADAGGGAGDWSVSVVRQAGQGSVSAPTTVTVPGSLQVTATGGGTEGDVEGFVVLTRGTDVRRIPYWFLVTVPQLAAPQTTLTRPGLYAGTTKGGPARVGAYRYPTGGDGRYPGPERSYRITLASSPANAGVVVLSGSAVPHVVFAGLADHLTGYAGLPLDINPYRASYGRRVRVAGVVLPSPGRYDIVFDTRSARLAGPFTFRYWVNDVTPPRLRVAPPTAGAVVVSATDSGSGVDPSSVKAQLDGREVSAPYSAGSFRIKAAKGTHRLVLEVSDYQENKNMEDVVKILPNTSILRATVRVR